MFDFDRQLCKNHRTVAAEAQDLNAEQKQRDIFEAHRHRVFSVSYYMTENELEAEALLTNTFIQAFTAIPEPEAHDIDVALLKELEQRFSLVPSVSAKPDGDGPLTRGQIRRTDMEEAVATLPPGERLVFLLRDVESYSSTRIASLLRCDEGEVQKTLISARIRMRNALGKLGTRNAPPSWQEAAALEVAIAHS